MKKQIVYLLNNVHCDLESQQIELSKLFSRYDIQVVLTHVSKNDDEIKTLLSGGDVNVTVLAALYIENYLSYTEARYLKSGLIPVKEESIVHAYRLDVGNVTYKCFSDVTEGYVPDFIATQVVNVMDIFILKHTLLTYSELEQYNMKNSSNALAVSKFICDEIYYDSPINLNFNPQVQSGTIDFRNDPANIILDNQYFNNRYASEYGLTNIFNTVLNKGIFFRSAKNRREKNYWYPSLNAGLPLVPKRDLIHEITYMAHDFSHFLIPDLIYTGEHTALSQQVYIAYRMMSESFTLVLADMLFVDSLQKCGFEYDYTKRRIYPLFQECEIDFTNTLCFPESVKTLLHASMQYCLRGNDSEFYQLSKSYRGTSNNLDLFKEKYMKFFCEDFKWTRHNYLYFKNQSDDIKKWWTLVSPLREHTKLDIETIDEFLLNATVRDNPCLIEGIFNELYKRIITILAGTSVRVHSFEKRQTKAFYRYIIGQLFMLIRYEKVVREALVFQRIIVNYLLDIKDEINQENIQFCRSVFSDFILILLERNLINHDDAKTFNEVFPLFEPCFAFYDEKDEFYKDLSVVAYNSIYAS